jgi:beta-lactamase superfamily II metal-dependent hydrolase
VSLRHLLLLLLAAAALAVSACGESRPEVVWTMVDVSYEPNITGDANLLVFADGTTILIDTGYEQLAKRNLLPVLEHQGIHTIDALIVSHAHKNHYGGMLSLLDAGLTVRKVYFNVPAREACDNERPWGCDYLHVTKTLEELHRRGVAVEPMKPGEVIYRDAKGPTTLRVLYVFDGLHTPVGRTSINDTSAVLRLDVGGTGVMFSGDLDHSVGSYLAEHGTDLRAQILKVPHHGVESAAPDAFFDRVGPKLALVPGPAQLWRSERAARLRNYFQSHHIPVYTNGDAGDIRVEIDGAGHYRISTARAPK